VASFGRGWSWQDLPRPGRHLKSYLPSQHADKAPDSCSRWHAADPCGGAPDSEAPGVEPGLKLLTQGWLLPGRDQGGTRRQAMLVATGEIDAEGRDALGSAMRYWISRSTTRARWSLTGAATT
jgi:hypothetical protein